MPNLKTSQKVATPVTSRFCKIHSASIVDINEAGDGAYDLLGVNGSPEEVGAKILDALQNADLSKGTQSILDSGEPVTLNIHVTIRKVKVTNGEMIPTLDGSTPWFIRYDDGRVCPEGGWATKSAAQEFCENEVGVPAHVELFV